MMAVNLGTRGVESARDLVEYCNFPGGSKFSDLRRANGHDKPHSIRYWCLGNEMDGPWQICGKTAEEYGRIAHETAKMMKWIDPSIELVACGSSNTSMPTYGEWEKTVLKHCYNDVNYVSLHSYYRNDDHDIPSFLASNIDMENMIQYIGSICKQAKIEQKGDHDVYLSFDEWNVWYHFSTEQKAPEKWVVGRAIDEEDYDDIDTLVVGTLMNALIRNADLVKVSCFAQLINVIAPITTVPGGEAYVRTIYYPIMHASNYGRGTSIKPVVDAPTYDCKLYNGVPMLDSAVVKCDDGSLSVFVVNRSETEQAELKVDFSGMGEFSNAELMTIRGMQTVTEKAEVEGSVCNTVLAPLSWNLIRIS
jgi:alpha-N-arabinofuranosidase